ncbi:NAD(P)-binding protein [Rhizobium anhuiense]|uniref:NAD(P)-binding protein n=1 Tax=Rhizobium anhuiense TaxID=1184720 RepID=UPI0015CF02F3|nr:NAD-binding protein [Rhizobium anhuiense]
MSGNPDVAVVGGGLAGLMTCAALISKQCNVTLIEMRDDLLDRQAVTVHRYVHPTVNFWPEKELAPTTELPFLDWYEDKCSEVIDTIRREWQQHFEGGLTDLLLRTRVKSIDKATSGKPSLTLFRNQGRSDEVEEKREFDLVFVTSGFGEEFRIQDIEPSYWEADGLDAARKAGTKSFFVAGTGDGGLIDALRLVQSKFDYGRICLNVVKALDTQGASERVAEIEDMVWRDAEHDEGEASRQYFAAYTELLGRLSMETRRELAERHSDIEVTLVGRLPHPFGLYVAPIHKVLMASALNAGKIRYVQGDLERDGDWYQIKQVDASAVPINIERNSKVVVRIGPTGPLSGLLDEGEVKRLRENQRRTSDLLSPVPLDLEFFSGYKNMPARDLTSRSFVKSRKRMADDYLHKNHRVSSKIGLSAGLPNFTLVLPDEMEDASFPSKLFGIGLVRDVLDLGEGL